MQVLSAGDNSDGQCAKGDMKTKDTDVGKTSEEVETCSVPVIKDFDVLKNYSGPPVVKVSAGSDFTMLLDINGVAWTFGSQEFGQLGSGPHLLSSIPHTPTPSRPRTYL